MKKLTVKQVEKISKNVKAYLGNFTPIKIIKVNNYFLMYEIENFNISSSNYFYSAENIDHLNGFLYGMVKGKHSSNMQKEIDFNIKENDILSVFEI